MNLNLAYKTVLYHLWLSSRSFAPIADIGEIGPEPGGRPPVFCMVLMISSTSFMSVSSSFRSSSKPEHLENKNKIEIVLWVG